MHSAFSSIYFDLFKLSLLEDQSWDVWGGALYLVGLLVAGASSSSPNKQKQFAYRQSYFRAPVLSKTGVTTSSYEGKHMFCFKVSPVFSERDFGTPATGTHGPLESVAIWAERSIISTSLGSRPL